MTEPPQSSNRDTGANFVSPPTGRKKKRRYRKKPTKVDTKKKEKEATPARTTESKKPDKDNTKRGRDNDVLVPPAKKMKVGVTMPTPEQEQAIAKRAESADKERLVEIKKRAKDVRNILSQHEEKLKMKFDMEFCMGFCRQHPTAFDSLLQWVYVSFRLCAGVKAEQDSTHFGLSCGIHHALDLIVEPKDPKQKMHLEYKLLARNDVAKRLREHSVGERYKALLEIVNTTPAAVPGTEGVKSTTVRDYIRVYYDLFRIYAIGIKCPPNAPLLTNDTDQIVFTIEGSGEKDSKFYVKEMHEFFSRLLAGCSFSQLIKQKNNLKSFLGSARDFFNPEVKESVSVKFDSQGKFITSLYEEVRKLWKTLQPTSTNSEKKPSKCRCIRIEGALNKGAEAFHFLKFFVPTVFEYHFVTRGGSVEVPYSEAMVVTLYCLRTFLNDFAIKIKGGKISFSFQDNRENATIVVCNNDHPENHTIYVQCSHVFSMLKRYPDIDLSKDEHLNTVRSVIAGGKKLYEHVAGQDEEDDESTSKENKNEKSRKGEKRANIAQLVKNSAEKARIKKTPSDFHLHRFVKDFTKCLEEDVSKGEQNTLLVVHNAFYSTDEYEQQVKELEKKAKGNSEGNVLTAEFKLSLDSEGIVESFLQQLYIKKPECFSNVGNAVFISDRVNAALTGNTCAKGNGLRKILKFIKCHLVVQIDEKTFDVLSKTENIRCESAELEWLPPSADKSCWAAIWYDATANIEEEVADGDDEKVADGDDDNTSGDRKQRSAKKGAKKKSYH